MDRFRVAIRPPLEQRRYLRLCCCGLPAVAWFEPDDFLVTLRCFGDVQEAARLDLLEALEEVESAPLALGLASCQIGPRHGGGTVSLQAIRNEPLDALIASIDRATRPLRLKQRGGEEPRLILGTYRHCPAYTDDYLLQFAGLTVPAFVATQFGVYREHTSPKRTYFQEEQAYSLADRLIPPG